MTGVRDSASSNGACRIVVTAPAAAAAHVEAAVEAFCQAMLCEPAPAASDHVRITGFARTEPDRVALSASLAAAATVAGITPPVVAIQPEPACDWLALNRETFRAFRIGRFFISEELDPVTAPTGAIHLRIDAGLAFGSGRHASTAGCLMALCDPLLTHAMARWCGRHRQAAREASLSSTLAGATLDLGCGSGILAIAAAKLWHRPVLGVDIDRAAVSVAARNAHRNGVGPLVRVIAANATQHPTVCRLRPFRLIIANILARPLRHMAPAVVLASTTGTILVLAGFVEDDAKGVETVYASHGFRRLKALTIDRWTTLVLIRC